MHHTRPFLEAHHIRWFSRDEGPTDVDNGVMLCSYHHHLVHATTTPIELMRWRGATYVVPLHHLGPPLPEQRVQRGPFGDPSSARRRGSPSRSHVAHDSGSGPPV